MVSPSFSDRLSASFAQDGGNLGAGAGGGGIHFPLRLYALRFGGQYLYLVTALQFVA